MQTIYDAEGQDYVDGLIYCVDSNLQRKYAITYSGYTEDKYGNTIYDFRS